MRSTRQAAREPCRPRRHHGHDALYLPLRLQRLLRPFLTFKPCTQCGLPLAEIRKERLDVIIAFRGQLLAGSIDFRDNRIITPDVTRPSILRAFR